MSMRLGLGLSIPYRTGVGVKPTSDNDNTVTHNAVAVTHNAVAVTHGAS